VPVFRDDGGAEVGSADICGDYGAGHCCHCIKAGEGAGAGRSADVGGVPAPEFEGFAELRHGGGVNGGGIQYAVFKVAIKDEEAGGFEAGAGGEELGEDVLTAALFFEHFAEAANLAFDTGEAVKEFLFVFGRHGGRTDTPHRYASMLARGGGLSTGS
jgi:hypothetical protein